MNKREQIEKEYRDERDAASKSFSVRLERAFNKRNNALKELNEGKKKGATPKDRPKLRKQPVQPSARKG